MDKLNLHWTSKSISAFVHRLSFDFITQIQQRLQNAHVTRKEFATRLKVTPGRVSQVFNDPGNITVERAVEYAQGAGMKVSLVAYDDSDPQNEKGPINSEVFRRCWQLHGCPHDLLDMGSATGSQLFNFAYERTSANNDFTEKPLSDPESIADTITKTIEMVQ